MSETLKIFIPMAGWGTRMRPHTWSKPKPLVSVAGKTSLEHLLDMFERLRWFRERQQGQIDRERRKTVERRIKVLRISSRVLVVLMADLAGRPPFHRGNKDSVVVHQTQLAVFDDDVAVL